MKKQKVIRKAAVAALASGMILGSGYSCSFVRFSENLPGGGYAVPMYGIPYYENLTQEYGFPMPPMPAYGFILPTPDYGFPE